MKFKVNAKFILSGEHAVIRGAKAIAFPATNYEMKLFASKRQENKRYPMPVEFKNNFEDIIKFVNSKFNLDILSEYSFRVESDIPVSCGFGSSAAISVLISKFISQTYNIKNEIDLAIEIENLLHGKSSGLDVYAIYFNKPIIFQIIEKQCFYEFIEPAFTPKFRIFMVDSEKNTRECISLVNTLLSTNFSSAKKLDSQMNLATNKCIYGIRNGDITMLADGINLAAKCFDNWGLITQKMKSKILEIYRNGAIACKPIGSGGGGGILALFE